MGKKAEYPVSLLKVLKVNDVTRSEIDYRDLTDDQMCGLEYALQNNLTEREAIVIRHYYQENMSMTAIAEKYNLPANRIKQIIRQAERKFQSNPEWLFYIANGYEAQTEYMQEQLKTEEKAYCETRGIHDKSHLFYQDIASLGFPTRVLNPLTRAGLITVRDLVIYIGSSNRIRKIGELSCKLVCDKLVEINLLPAEMEKDCRNNRFYNVSRLDEEVKVFKKLNSY